MDARSDPAHTTIQASYIVDGASRERANEQDAASRLARLSKLFIARPPLYSKRGLELYTGRKSAPLQFYTYMNASERARARAVRIL